MLIPLSKLINDFKLVIRGVIHVGAHECEELLAYNQAGITIDKILWFEAQETKCKTMIAQNTALRIKQAIISDIDDAKVSFMVTNNSQSSSMLHFGSHAKYHPQVIEQSRFDGTTITLDTIFKRDNEDPKKYNFLNMDIQGAELLALKGATSILPHIDYIYLEVNDEEVYKGCGLITDIDSLLATYHFKRVATVMTENHWGDALYIKTLSEITTTGSTKLLKEIKSNNNDNNILYGQHCAPKFTDDSNAHTNGDLWFWSQIKSNVSTLIDVGVGDNLLYSWHQGLTHHCFEPNLLLYNKINNPANAWRIINPYGLGAPGSNKIVSYYNHSQSVRRRAHYKCPEDCQCKTTINISTLDQYISENKITRINLLKVNSEGYELDVLKGSSKALQVTDFVQFIYGGHYPDNNISLADVYTFLRSKGFIHIYLIQENYLLPVKQPIENWKYSNYVACKVEAHVIIAKSFTQSLTISSDQLVSNYIKMPEMYALYGYQQGKKPEPFFGDNHNGKTNGEQWLWSLIKKRAKTIIDVGIQTEMTYNDEKTITQHCFEPNVKFYQAIKKYANERVIINNIGLGSSKGSVSYYAHSESINKRDHHKCKDDCSCKTMVNIMTLDQYVDDHKILHIDFIKIDVEGYELEVLLGAKKSLAKTDLVQFEYGSTYRDNNITLTKVYQYLQANGFYFIYYINPSSLCRCETPSENYRYANYLASKVPAHTLLM